MSSVNTFDVNITTKGRDKCDLLIRGFRRACANDEDSLSTAKFFSIFCTSLIAVKKERSGVDNEKH